MTDYERGVEKASSVYKEVIREYVAENEELRECLEDIADHIQHGDGFGVDQGWVLDRMRELGVEVIE